MTLKSRINILMYHVGVLQEGQSTVVIASFFGVFLL